MGGKGRRRREKNYRAAHGGFNLLPPPPDPSSLDAVPSKLRKIMSLTSSSLDIEQRKKRRDDGSQNKINRNDELHAKTSGIIELHNDDVVGSDGEVMAPQQQDDNDEIVPNSITLEKKQKKRKRKQVKDLRFDVENETLGIGSKRKERKKKYLAERKKQQKKPKTEENLEFPGHEKIRFGEVVEAPPKLVVIPKALKTSQDASKERLRLQAVEAYRKRKGWASRPGGIHLPPPVTT